MSRIKIGNIKGPKGDKGEQGAVGPKGEQGIQGPVGPAGGVDSVNGKTGDVDIVDALGYTPVGGQGVNLILQSNVEYKNSNYEIAKYESSVAELEVDKPYTVTYCVTPAEGVKAFTLYKNSGNGVLVDLPVSGTKRQIISATFTCPSYYLEENYAGFRPNIYRLPNDGSVTGESIIHWVKVESGTVTDPVWTPAPEDVVVRSELEKKIGSFDWRIENVVANDCVITERLGHVSIAIYAVLPNTFSSYIQNNKVVLGTVKGITNPSYHIRKIVATQANHVYDKVNPCYGVLNMNGEIEIFPTVNTDKSFIINIDYDV